MNCNTNLIIDHCIVRDKIQHVIVAKVFDTALNVNS